MAPAKEAGVEVAGKVPAPGSERSERSAGRWKEPVETGAAMVAASPADGRVAGETKWEPGTTAEARTRGNVEAESE